jgi:signal transduction histidine kinase
MSIFLPVTIEPADFAAIEKVLRTSRTRIALGLGAVMMIAGGILDRMLQPTRLFEFLLLRILVALVLLVGWVYFSRSPKPAGIMPLSVVLLLLPTLAIVWMIYRIGDTTSQYVFGLILLVFFIPLLGFHRWEALIFCGTLLLAFCLASRFPFVRIGEGSLATGFFLLTTCCVSIFTCHLMHQSRLREFSDRCALDDKNRELRKLDQLRSEFLANVSHELRTPLTMMVAPLDQILSERGAVSQPVGELLSMLRRNVDRLRMLVDDLLDMVRSDHARLHLQLESVDGRSFLQEIVWATEGIAAAKQVKLTMQATTEPIDLRIDPFRMERVLTNLLTNAIKHSPEHSEVVIGLNRVGDTAELTCLDAGTGVAPEYREKIFERFFRVSPADARFAQGLGLGLAIVKEIVVAHGGSVSCEGPPASHPRGSLFRVRLPLEMGNESEHHRNTPASASRSREDVPARTKSLKIAEESIAAVPVSVPETPQISAENSVLVIDDERDIREYLGALLKQDYPNVSVSDSAMNGLERARQLRPRCILLDMMLPDRDGLWALTRLRSMPECSDSKILMLTAHADESLKLRALQLGVDEFLSKPFSVVELRARVAGLMRSARLQNELRKEKDQLERLYGELRTTQAQLFHSEKIRAIGSLTKGLLHEINNPVTFTKMAIAVLQRDLFRTTLLDDSTRETLKDIEDGVQRVAEIVSDLRSFAYHEQVHLTDIFPIEKSLDTALRFAAHEIQQVQVRVDPLRSSQLWVEASRSQTTQVFLNLILNASRAVLACTDGREKRITVSAEPRKDRVFITVGDEGIGMNPQLLSNVRDPFFTTKDVGQGMGLGLGICDSIVRGHGGQLQITSEENIGTTVVFDLPLASPPEGKT